MSRSTLAMCAVFLCYASFFLVRSAAQVQHPCDAAPVATATVTAGGVQVGWCHDGKDEAGNPTAISTWALYAGSVRTVVTNAVVTGGANSSGEFFYVATVQFSQGNYQVTVAAINGAGEGARTPPFSLNVENQAPVEALPRAPKLFRAG